MTEATQAETREAARAPGVYFSVYFAFRYFPEVEIVRVGGMEVYRDDPGPYPPSLWDQPHRMDSIEKENEKTVLYMDW